MPAPERLREESKRRRAATASDVRCDAFMTPFCVASDLRWRHDVPHCLSGSIPQNAQQVQVSLVTWICTHLAQADVQVRNQTSPADRPGRRMRHKGRPARRDGMQQTGRDRGSLLQNPQGGFRPKREKTPFTATVSQGIFDSNSTLVGRGGATLKEFHPADSSTHHTTPLHCPDASNRARLLPLSPPILQRLGQVLRLHLLAPRQIGNGTRELQHAMIAPSAQTQLPHGLLDQPPPGIV